jgi:hypothetical protein
MGSLFEMLGWSLYIISIHEYHIKMSSYPITWWLQVISIQQGASFYCSVFLCSTSITYVISQILIFINVLDLPGATFNNTVNFCSIII